MEDLVPSITETRVRDKEIIIRFGEIGQTVILTRVYVKNKTGLVNKGKKINQLETIVLEGPVIIGKPIVKTKEADEFSRKKSSKINVTSRIIGVTLISRNFYELESLNSIYNARFIYG